MRFWKIVLAVHCVIVAASTAFQCPDQSPCECRRENARLDDKLVTYNVLMCEGSFGTARVNFSFVGHIHLKTLELKNTSLKHIGRDTFQGLNVKEVKIIDSDATFSDNAFEAIKDTLRHLSLIRIKTIAKEWTLPFLKGFSELESLALDGNGKFPFHFQLHVFQNLSLTSIRSLSLRHCGIAVVNDLAFFGLESLEVLDLSYNQLSYIPGTIKLLTNLKHFIMTNNDKLTYIIDGTFVSLKNLVTIDLGHSMINTIQDRAFNGLEDSLEELKLNNGSLQHGHFTSMKALRRLRYLDISYNRITEMHNSSFVGFFGLEYLDVSGQEDGADRLVLVDAAFRGIDKTLQTLKLRDSGMDYTLPLAPLSSLTRLSVLDVSMNDFKEISESFFDGVRAKTIIMTDMEITEISSEAFNTLSPNVEIIFDRNNITNISFILDTKLCAFNKLSFQENPIVCDCEVVEIAATNRVENLIGKCADSFYRGEQLRHLHMLDITKKTCGEHQYKRITHCYELNHASTHNVLTLPTVAIVFLNLVL